MLSEAPRFYALPVNETLFDYGVAEAIEVANLWHFHFQDLTKCQKLQSTAHLNGVQESVPSASSAYFLTGRSQGDYQTIVHERNSKSRRCQDQTTMVDAVALRRTASLELLLLQRTYSQVCSTWYHPCPLWNQGLRLCRNRSRQDHWRRQCRH